MKELLLTLSLCIILSACQPTPDSPIVVGKQNDGWKESVILTPDTSGTAQNAQDIEYFTAPAEFKAESYISEKLTINYDAEVVYPENSMFPIYLMKEHRFTQEEADKFIDVFVGDGYFHEASDVLTKSVVENKIQMYQTELQWAIENDITDNVDIYKQILEDLYVQLETAPDIETLAPASRTFLTVQDATEEERQIQDREGYEYIFGYVELENGRLGRLSIENNSLLGTGVSFIGNASYTDSYYNEPINEGEDIGIEAAQVIAEDLLAALGVEFDFIRSEIYDSVVSDGENTVPDIYAFEYCMSVDGVDVTDSNYRRGGNVVEGEYGSPIYQDSITITISGGELHSFSWWNPAEVAQTEAANTELIPFEEITEIVKIGMQMQHDVMLDDVIKEEYDVSEIALNYMQVKKENNSSERYYIPVWDVIGQQGQTYIFNNGNKDLDGEVMNSESEELRHLLTVNAIDGTFIDRSLGY